MNRIAILLAASLAASGCAEVAPTIVAPTGLRIGAASEPSSFEKKEASKHDGDTFDNPETSKAQKRRTTAFWAGVGLAGFGAAGSVGFGIGGRISQTQLSNGYDDKNLTHADEDRIRNQGKVMNALTSASVAVALFGVAMLSIAYAIDHARCGNLPPRRKRCPDKPRPDKKPPPPSKTDDKSGTRTEGGWGRRGR